MLKPGSFPLCASLLTQLPKPWFHEPEDQDEAIKTTLTGLIHTGGLWPTLAAGSPPSQVSRAALPRTGNSSHSHKA